jgi:hypothetical protein
MSPDQSQLRQAENQGKQVALQVRVFGTHLTARYIKQGACVIEILDRVGESGAHGFPVSQFVVESLHTVYKNYRQSSGPIC